MDLCSRESCCPRVHCQSSRICNSKFIFSALPDFLESSPFLIFITLNKKKYHLKNLGLRSILSFAVNINHIKQDEYRVKFPWAAKISFYTHSFLLSAILASFLFLVSKWLFVSFLIGYLLHLFVDIFLHKDYFSSRPFYPLSNFAIQGFITWYKVKNFSTYNYGLLAILYFFEVKFVVK